MRLEHLGHESLMRPNGAFNYRKRRAVRWSMNDSFQKHSEPFCSVPKSLCILWCRQFTPGSICNCLIIFCHTGPLLVLISSVWFSRTYGWLGKCQQFLWQSLLHWPNTSDWRSLTAGCLNKSIQLAYSENKARTVNVYTPKCVILICVQLVRFRKISIWPTAISL